MEQKTKMLTRVTYNEVQCVVDKIYELMNVDNKGYITEEDLNHFPTLKGAFETLQSRKNGYEYSDKEEGISPKELFLWFTEGGKTDLTVEDARFYLKMFQDDLNTREVQCIVDQIYDLMNTDNKGYITEEDLNHFPTFKGAFETLMIGTSRYSDKEEGISRKELFLWFTDGGTKDLTLEEARHYLKMVQDDMVVPEAATCC